MSFHILLLDRAGNNLVNADFSLYSRMFFAVKHIYLTLYIAYTYHVTSTYSVPLYLARSARCPCGRVLLALAVRAARCARCLCGRVTVPAPVPAPVCARARVCGRVCGRVCVGARVAALASAVCVISFAYNVHSPQLCPACPPRCSLRSLRRKLF